jgi:hypothetical protein
VLGEANIESRPKISASVEVPRISKDHHVMNRKDDQAGTEGSSVANNRRGDGRKIRQGDCQERPRAGWSVRLVAEGFVGGMEGTGPCRIT